MRKYTEEQQKKAQAKYEAESIPNKYAYLLFAIIIIIALLADNF